MIESVEDMVEHEAEMGDMELDVEEVFICSNKGLLDGNSMAFVDLLDKQLVVLVDLLVELMFVVLVDFKLTGFVFFLTFSLTALFLSAIRI